MPPANTSSCPPVVLSIAGFDPTSGAGATADLQTIATHGLFGTACLTALTVQSTEGVARVQEVDASLLRQMLQVLLEDMPPAGIKVGMLGSVRVAHTVADVLTEWRARTRGPVIVDPVLHSSSGTALLETDAIGVLIERIFPLATCVTPNREELARLLRRSAIPENEVAESARALLGVGKAESMIVTGGALIPPRDLVVQQGQEPIWLAGEHVDTTSTHGTGCAFSSALACELVLGKPLLSAAVEAKSFLERSLREAPGLGKGRGPMKLSDAPYFAAPLPETSG